MKAYAATHTGLVRKSNEDAYYLPKMGERFAIVADGLGGHLAGEVASRMAVSEVARHMREASQPDEEVIQRAVRDANSLIYKAATDNISQSGMGTTLTALWFDNQAVHLIHVGDSRAYLLRNQALMQLSRDHSLVEEMMEKGELTPDEARVHPHRHLITRALGIGKKVEADIIRLDYQPEDVWLLCSDGLSNAVRNHEMAEILMGQEPWPLKMDRLIELALERGGKDNITAVVVAGEDET